ncbi:hypothetical protein B0A52_05549 [Exophiala mesophila]|uniref:Thioesterase domain-containing protein n=1 Tax=Exophiala mesophila TaxID=212818 RepID=A0A438N3K7_EXOME|nr:hypothetical protein B0A52_05549 [Exophiala mesophila]
MATKSRIYSQDNLSRPGVAFALHIEDPLKRIQACLDSYKASDDTEVFEYSLMANDLQLISATGLPHVGAVFELDVRKKYTNTMFNMQGGAVSLAFDMATTIATAPCATRDFWRFPGVSRTLSETFLRPIKLEMRVVIDCEVVQIGQRLAITRATMRENATGNMLAICEHNKASVVFKEPKL